MHKDILQGFKNFVMKGNVVDMAVGVVIGVAFSAVVNAMVVDLITPLIGALGGTPDFSGIFFTLNGSKFMIGEFINALISFLIIAAVVYFFVVVPMNKLLAKMKGETSADPSEKVCPECLSKVPVKAKRCKFCAQPLA